MFPIGMYFFIIGGVGLTSKSLGTAATSRLLYKPQMIDEDNYGATCGMMVRRGSRSTRRKSAPAPLCPLQIPHDQTRARIPDRRGGKPATNRLSYGAAPIGMYLSTLLTWLSVCHFLIFIFM
jgi:hypothetical protein